MTKAAPIALDYTRSLFELAKREFAFLTEQGFALVEQQPPTSASFRDGFHLRYALDPVDLVVDYYDMELVPSFHRGAERASYHFIDRHLFANASGYGGAMFPVDKLTAPYTPSRSMFESTTALFCPATTPLGARSWLCRTRPE
jgi:hypothetical protein